MCVWQPESRSWWRHAAFSTSCLRCGKLWQSDNSCTLVAVLNGWLESKPSNLFCWENHHMSCMPNWFTVWAGQRVAMILGGFSWSLLHHDCMHLFSKMTILPGLAGWGGPPLVLDKVRVESAPWTHQRDGLSWATSSPELFSHATPVPWRNRQCGKWRVQPTHCSLAWARGTHTALRPPLNPPLTVLDPNKTQLIWLFSPLALHFGVFFRPFLPNCVAPIVAWLEFFSPSSLLVFRTSLCVVHLRGARKVWIYSSSDISQCSLVPIWSDVLLFSHSTLFLVHCSGDVYLWSCSHWKQN